MRFLPILSAGFFSSARAKKKHAQSVLKTKNKGQKMKGGEPEPRHLHQQVWLLPSEPDQVTYLVMRGDPPTN